MDIRVYEVLASGVGKCLGIFDDYASFNFTKNFQKTGHFTIKGLLTEHNKKLLAPDRIIYINPQVSGIIHSVDYRSNEKGGIEYTAYGYDLKNLLSYRYNEGTYYRSCEATAYINTLVDETTGGKKDGMVQHPDDRKHLMLFNNIKKTLPFTVGTIEKQVSFKPLDKTVESVIEQCKYTSKGLLFGYDVTLDNNASEINFSLQEGKDRTANSSNPYIFSRGYDNIQSITVTNSTKDKANYVACGGEGEGINRVWSMDWKEPLQDGLLLRQKAIDARHLQRTYRDYKGEHTLTEREYSKLLHTQAKAALTEDTNAVIVEPVHLDMDTALSLLGSKVSIIDKELNINTTDYVSEINIIDEKDGLFTELTIGIDIETGGTF